MKGKATEMKTVLHKSQKEAKKIHVHITLFFSWILKKYLHIKSFFEKHNMSPGEVKNSWRTIGKCFHTPLFICILYILCCFYFILLENRQREKAAEWSEHQWTKCMFMEKLLFCFYFLLIFFYSFCFKSPLKKIMTE